jgi:hypothetical protein
MVGPTKETMMDRCPCGQFPDVCARYGHAAMCGCECHDPGVYGSEARSQDDPCGRCVFAHARLDALRSGDSPTVTAASEDRLRHVQPRTTYVIHLWRDGDIGGTTIGPYTKIETERVVATLTVPHHVERIGTRVPAWAQASPRYGEAEVAEAIRQARRTDVEVEREADAAIKEWDEA